MTREHLATLVSTVLAVAIIGAAPKSAIALGCHTRGSAGSSQVVIGTICPGIQRSKAAPAPPTKVVYCGNSFPRLNGLWNRACGAPRVCDRIVDGKRVDVEPFATVTFVHRHWTNPQLWCPGNGRAGMDLPALRDEARRRLPEISIGAAWSDMTLVNVQTLFWAGTQQDRELAPVSVLGKRVVLRIHLVRADWDFGDGTIDLVTTPGKPYDPRHDPCATPRCPDYFGHTFVRTGIFTIRLTVTWHVQYRPAGGDWTDIPGGITGPTSTHQLEVKEARGVLVPNPP